jgi:hypothetical protein
MSSPSLTGRELRELVFEKWGRSYDVCIAKRGSRYASGASVTLVLVQSVASSCGAVLS